jgi:Zn-dependent protease
MGAAGALGLFISIIFHELSHSLVARRFGLPIRGITLFIFGGVAEMAEEPPSAKAEFVMAVVGPISSILLGIGFYAIRAVGMGSGWPVPINGVIGYLAMINGLLAGFNLLPAFPLDGGRMLRSVLWGWRGNFRRATKIASRIGSGFGIGMIVLGVFSFLRGNFIGGIWWLMIGLFLRNASQMSYQQMLARRALEGERVSKFMAPDPVTVQPGIPLGEFVEDYIYQHHYKMFPVVDSGRLLGCVSIHKVKGIPKEEWGQHTVGELTDRCSPENTIAPEADALEALSLMNRTRSSRLMVVEGDRLVGVIALKDMLKFLSLKVELEE